jgi:hypothetical protein
MTKSIQQSETTYTELMIPSYANLGGKVHGGILLSIMDKVAYVCACKHSESYVVTVAVEGVEFLSGDGLRMKSETFNIRTLEGSDTAYGLLEDVFETLKHTREHMRWFGVSEPLMIKEFRKPHFDYFLRMKEEGLREHCLCGSKQKIFYAPPSVSDYRIMPQEFMGNVDFGVYGIKMCIGTFSKKYRVIIIEHEGIADAYRSQYDAFWNMAKPMTHYDSLFDADYERYLRNKKNKT